MAANKKHPDDVRKPFMVRLSARERAALQRRAKKDGTTVCEYIRSTMKDNLGRAWPKEKSL